MCVPEGFRGVGLEREVLVLVSRRTVTSVSAGVHILVGEEGEGEGGGKSNRQRFVGYYM